jgi:hypothetical protein
MFNNELWQKPAGGAGGGFYTHQIANSVRNSGAQNGTLKRTAGTPTSSDTFTLSYWVKKYTNSTSIVDQNIFVAGTGGGTYFIICIEILHHGIMWCIDMTVLKLPLLIELDYMLMENK